MQLALIDDKDKHEAAEHNDAMIQRTVLTKAQQVQENDVKIEATRAEKARSTKHARPFDLILVAFCPSRRRRTEDHRHVLLFCRIHQPIGKHARRSLSRGFQPRSATPSS
jgi:hypothetical protein